MSNRIISGEQKIELARDAMRGAMDIRFQLGLGLEEPMCAFTTCERLGVPVRFVDISMEGIYRPYPTPKIFISASRPIVRRHFSCAHELGHHFFGHGATLDELRETLEAYEYASPEEFQVNSFAGHLLMPVLGIRRAFSRRGIEPASARPDEILSVACEFGVGYSSLVTQLAVSLKDISFGRRRELLDARPVLRRSLVPKGMAGAIAFLDRKFSAASHDVEINHNLIVPVDAIPNNDCLAYVGNTMFGKVFKAVKRGTVELVVPKSSWAVSIRIAPEHFVGLARFRYLEDDS